MREHLCGNYDVADFDCTVHSACNTGIYHTVRVKIVDQDLCTMIYHLTQVRMAIIKKSTNNKC